MLHVNLQMNLERKENKMEVIFAVKEKEEISVKDLNIFVRAISEIDSNSNYPKISWSRDMIGDDRENWHCLLTYKKE